MADWTSSWLEVARRHTAAADASLGEDQFGDACCSYLHAVQCCAHGLEGAAQDGDRRAVKDAGCSAFHAAMPLLAHSVTTVEAGSGVDVLGGYLFAPEAPRAGAAAVVYEMDPDSLLEAGYLLIALPALTAGMACGIFGFARSPISSTAADALAGWLRAAPAVGTDPILLRRRSGRGLARPAGRHLVLDQPIHTVHTRDELLDGLVSGEQHH